MLQLPCFSDVFADPNFKFAKNNSDQEITETWRTLKGNYIFLTCLMDLIFGVRATVRAEKWKSKCDIDKL